MILRPFFKTMVSPRVLEAATRQIAASSDAGRIFQLRFI
jgi:hypothetical protein